MKFFCSCAPTVTFDSVPLWRTHYDSNKPQWARERLAYAKEHMLKVVPHVPYVSRHSDKSVQQVNEVEPTARLRQIQRQRETLLAELMRLEEEVERLYRQLEPVPQVPTNEWSRSDVHGTCKLKDCTQKTLWKRRGIYQCHPECKPRAAVSAEEKALLQDMLAKALES